MDSDKTSSRPKPPAKTAEFPYPTCAPGTTAKSPRRRGMNWIPPCTHSPLKKTSRSFKSLARTHRAPALFPSENHTGRQSTKRRFFSAAILDRRWHGMVSGPRKKRSRSDLCRQLHIRGVSDGVLTTERTARLRLAVCKLKIKMSPSYTASRNCAPKTAFSFFRRAAV